ncbi:methyl-accepting chemotaxis protein [uncultured Oscillibacter sp.]|uniref:methyl-accepting chemotaxis protein n=1 Tax=uncultured Oscillibacter sp. TaxID=876091 RepID=UPI0025FD3631|nr:methyl-accepting chemotaxis protein [uncultured Oscillibacter sp.]
MKRAVKKKEKSGGQMNRQGKRHSTIRKELMLEICILAAIPIILLGALTSFLIFSSTQDTLEQTMEQISDAAADKVQAELEAIKNVAMETGYVARLSDDSLTKEEKQAIIDQRAKAHGYQRGNVLNLDGKSLLDGVNYSDREYFKQAKAGKTWVSDPLVSKKTGAMTVVVAAPIWQGGVAGSLVTGVVYFVPNETFLNDIVSEIQVSENGGAYMLNKHGTAIADQNMDVVVSQRNTAEEAKTDASLAALAELETKMTEGGAGFGQYTYNGVTKLLAYAPIENSDGWSLAINAPVNDFMGSTFRAIFITMALIALTIVGAVVVALRLSKRIGDPVAKCTRRLELLAQGDLSSPVPEVRSRNETKRLAEATSSITQTISGIIGDFEQGLSGVAHGDLTVSTANAALYQGDYAALRSSLEDMILRMTHTMRQIGLSADQVALGSEQVAAGAQALSQGATEQASSVEELAATVTEVSIQIGDTSKNAEVARRKVDEAGTAMQVCDRQMKDMVSAMDEISENSKQIGRIIKTIEDIAFQTNILALNAAVEAARAGEAGKGFAVVADEVRNLAGKSAAASKDTATLIEAAVQSVAKGTGIADTTAANLDAAAVSSRATAEMVEKIADAAQQQAAAIAQISQGIDQISGVVQNNSATSEESAASSEEMSAQAQTLRELVGQFKLRDEQEAVPIPAAQRREEPPVEPYASAPSPSFAGKY